MEKLEGSEENPGSFEKREKEIDVLIDALAGKEGMAAGDIICDIIIFAPTEENEYANPDYIEQVAEMIGITVEEMIEYAIKKTLAQAGE